MRIETTVGPCTLRKRGAFWYARIQRKKRRLEIHLRTQDAAQAVANAHELVPSAILGRQELLTSSDSIPNEAYYRGMYGDVRARARRNGQEFALTEYDWMELIDRANGRCELTGIVFSLVRTLGAYRAPFAPSVDRIDAAVGYTRSNVRFVCCAVNYALQDWGIGVFDTITLSYAAKKIGRMAGEITGPKR
jgi:hypothetical protein